MGELSTTLNKLLDVAESSVRLRGYHAVSFRELADDLGIKSSSVHHYFPRKEDLAVALLRRYSDNFFTELEAQCEKLRAPNTRLSVHFKVYRESLVTTQKFCLCGMLGAESGGIPEVVGEAVSEFFKKNVAWVDEALPSSLSAADRNRKAQHIVAAMQGAMMMASSQKDFKIFDNIVRDLVATQEV